MSSVPNEWRILVFADLRTMKDCASSSYMGWSQRNRSSNIVWVGYSECGFNDPSRDFQCKGKGIRFDADLYDRSMDLLDSTWKILRPRAKAV